MAIVDITEAAHGGSSGMVIEADNALVCPICPDVVNCTDQKANKERSQPRKSNEMRKWYSHYGYQGPNYCKRCSEVFNNHLLHRKGKHKNRAGCTRLTPCVRCKAILDQVKDVDRMWDLTGKSMFGSRNKTYADCPICPESELAKTNKNRSKPRKSNEMKRWYSHHGYQGPNYCKRCSEVFNNHLLRRNGKHKNRAGCTRLTPCVRCKAILDQVKDVERMWDLAGGCADGSRTSVFAAKRAQAQAQLVQTRQQEQLQIGSLLRPPVIVNCDTPTHGPIGSRHFTLSDIVLAADQCSTFSGGGGGCGFRAELGSCSDSGGESDASTSVLPAHSSWIPRVKPTGQSYSGAPPPLIDLGRPAKRLKTEQSYAPELETAQQSATLSAATELPAVHASAGQFHGTVPRLPGFAYVRQNLLLCQSVAAR